MEIFLLLSILIIAIFFGVKQILYSAKRNLFRDQASWSGKDLNIKYIHSEDNPESQENDNYLKIIANESKLYLDDQAKEEEE
tara:strand:- start:919 stop:1164 length:246 start_codon:yes stop_codon:yes gene_type:complete